MVTLKVSGDFRKTAEYLNRMRKLAGIDSLLDYYGKVGVKALSAATPVDSGATAASWYYKVEKAGKDGASYSLSFFNSNINKGVPIALILQYGHGTRNGGWVQGRDYINPALQPVFDELLKTVWKEVCK